MITEIPLLQNVRVASPCSASWEAMEPVEGERVRFCEGCQKRVYNLSAMGQAEAEGLLRQHEGRLCIRYYRRRDGTVLTTDCPVGLKAARQMVFRRAGATVALFALFCTAFALEKANEATMGDRGTFHSDMQEPVTGKAANAVPEVTVTKPSVVEADDGATVGFTEPTMGDAILCEFMPILRENTIQDEDTHIREALEAPHYDKPADGQ